MSDSQAKTRWESAGMLAGIVVFLLGVVLLMLVFVWTFALFQDAKQTVSLASAKPIDAPLPTVVAGIGFQVALLFVMGYVASLIGSKGLQLYGVCRGVSPR
ncbi:MAG: hypothetical protein JSV65_01160 [Armatimonadota bacterium]|nr:MAG: hypothetical protein JSV65_01160 [Armatimonadota bacterium]